MKISRVLMLALCAVIVTGSTGCDKIMGLFRARQAAVKWEGDIKEIAFQSIEKEGKTFDIELHSRIDAPIDKVWAALKTPENLADNSEQYKLSKLLKQEGNSKELEIRLIALDNLQVFTVRLTFDDAKKIATIKTLSSTLADIDGTYELKASPDGAKTLYIYKAKQTDKVILPLSVDVQRSAIKESFVNQVRAVKKQLSIS